MAEEQLMDFLHFDQADLTANRTGKFTVRQQDRLVQDDKRNRLFMTVGGGVAAAVALFSLIFGIVSIINSHSATTGLTYGVALGVVVPLIFGAVAARSFWKGLGPHQIRLASVQGPVDLKRREGTDEDGRHFTVVNLRVGGRKFDVRPGLEKIMVEGTEYKVYYIEGTNTILSAEALGRAK